MVSNEGAKEKRKKLLLSVNETTTLGLTGGDNGGEQRSVRKKKTKRARQ